MRKSKKGKKRIQHATLYMLHGQEHGQEPRSYVPRLSPPWVFMRHSPFLIPNSLGISAFRAKAQRSISYDKGPVTVRMKGIFAFSTNDRRAWNILPFLKSPTQGDGRAIYPAHPLPAYTFFGLIYYFPKYNIQRC